MKQEANAVGGTRTIGLALDLSELNLRAQEERLKALDAAAAALNAQDPDAPGRS